MKNNTKLLLLCIFLMFVFAIFSAFDNGNYDSSNTYDENNSIKSQYNRIDSTNISSTNHERALTDEEAEELSGTGYHNTRPNSSAESMEIQAAKVKCKRCGMRSHNGLNSLCDSCLRAEELIKDD